MMNIFDKFLYKIRSTFYKKKKIISVKHNSLEVKFINNNELTLFRSLSFSNKEPETLKWINRFEKNSTFFDIGANVGLYSIYAAKLTGANVYAFEPSVLNLEILYKNIDLNNLNLFQFQSYLSLNYYFENQIFDFLKNITCHLA